MLGFRFAPIVTEPPGEFEQNLCVIARARRKWHGSSNTLDTALAARDRSFTLTPSGRSRQDYIRELGRMGEEKILDYQNFRPLKSWSAR